jgi:hypothetical protein
MLDEPLSHRPVCLLCDSTGWHFSAGAGLDSAKFVGPAHDGGHHVAFSGPKKTSGADGLQFISARRARPAEIFR